MQSYQHYSGALCCYLHTYTLIKALIHVFFAPAECPIETEALWYLVLLTLFHHRFIMEGRKRAPRRFWNLVLEKTVLRGRIFEWSPYRLLISLTVSIRTNRRGGRHWASRNTLLLICHTRGVDFVVPCSPFCHKKSHHMMWADRKSEMMSPPSLVATMAFISPICSRFPDRSCRHEVLDWFWGV